MRYRARSLRQEHVPHHPWRGKAPVVKRLQRVCALPEINKSLRTLHLGQSPMRFEDEHGRTSAPESLANANSPATTGRTRPPDQRQGDRCRRAASSGPCGTAVMVAVELVELCCGGFVDFSAIKRPIVIGVKRGNGICGAVCAGLQANGSHEQRGDGEASSQASHHFRHLGWTAHAGGDRTRAGGDRTGPGPHTPARHSLIHRSKLVETDDCQGPSACACENLRSDFSQARWQICSRCRRGPGSR